MVSLFYSFVYGCVGGGLYVHMCACMCGQPWLWRLRDYPPWLLRQSLSLGHDGAYPFDQAGWPASPQGSSCLCVLGTRLTGAHTYLTWLFFFTRDLGLTLRAGTLQTKTSLCLYGFSLPPMNCPNTFFPTMTGIKKMKHHLNTVVTILSNLMTKTATKWLPGRSHLEGIYTG